MAVMVVMVVMAAPEILRMTTMPIEIMHTEKSFNQTPSGGRIKC